MNIVIFSKHFYPENFKINLISQELSKSHFITVFTGNNTRTETNIGSFSLSKKFKYKGINVFAISTYIKKNINFKNIFLDYFFYIYNVSKNIFFNQSNIKCDVILTFATSPIFQTIPAIILAKLKKKPSIVWVQDLWPEVLADTNYINNKLILGFINFFVKKIYSFSDYIFVQSYSFKSHLEKKYLLKNIKVLYQPADYEFQKFSRTNNKKKFIITYAGNFGFAQEFDTIIQASKSINLNKNIKIQLIGSGKMVKYLEDKILTNKIHNIKIYKNKSKDQIKKYLTNSDAFLLTLKNGLSLNKTIPGKFQTYISFGKPIISISPGYISNYIKNNKIGLCSNPNDINSLINNLNRVSSMKLNEKKYIYNNCKDLYFIYFDIKKISNNINKFVSKLNVKKNIS